VTLLIFSVSAVLYWMGVRLEESAPPAEAEGEGEEVEEHNND
jgi:hypothetical protein